MAFSCFSDWNHPAARGTSQERVCVGDRGHGFKGGCLLAAGGPARQSGCQAVLSKRQDSNRIGMTSFKMAPLIRA